jgi:extracellular elastinolytic metalloproteinase
MIQIRSLRPLLSLVFSSLFLLTAAQRPDDELGLLREMLAKEGFFPADLEELEIRDAYTSAHNGVRHTFVRQHWQGIEVFNGDIALHRAADGRILRINNKAWKGIAKMVNTTEPAIDATAALRAVLEKTRPGTPLPRPLESDADGRVHRFDGSALGNEPVEVRLCFVPVGDSLRLAWNVNHYTPDGTHWWNVRIDAVTGAELERNDWVSQCDFGHEAHGCTHEAAPAPEDLGPPPPASPNDYRVYAWPEESPSHGPRTLQNAPWTDGGIASPFGWHDTDGVAGPEFTDTRGNNCRAQEDQDANNSGGYRPDGGPDLDFDFPIDLAQPPTAYQDALITNLFYWNNVIHDVWYQYGFDEVSGNFQQNNYGRGGAGGDFVWADALDGSGTNNANFGTPPDGSNPRMQMFVWTQTSPHRTSDLDNGVIAHEYGHGLSNRLVAGPSNVSCLWNAEQMGEGWSDYLGLVMTMKPGDTGPSPRGIGTYVLGQPTSGGASAPHPTAPASA